MFLPAQHAEHSKRIGSILGLFKNVLIQHDDRIGAEHEVAGDGAGFLARKPANVLVRCFAVLNLFRNACNADCKGYAGAFQNLTAARRLRGQY